MVCEIGGFGRLEDSASTSSETGVRAQRQDGELVEPFGLSSALGLRWGRALRQAQRPTGSATDGKPMSGAVSTSASCRRRSQT